MTNNLDCKDPTGLSKRWKRRMLYNNTIILQIIMHLLKENLLVGLVSKNTNIFRDNLRVIPF